MKYEVTISLDTYQQILKALEKIDNYTKENYLQHSVLCNFSSQTNRDFCNCGIADCRKTLDMLNDEMKK